jgi:hypothetical protein
VRYDSEFEASARPLDTGRRKVSLVSAWKQKRRENWCKRTGHLWGPTIPAGDIAEITQCTRCGHVWRTFNHRRFVQKYADAVDARSMDRSKRFNYRPVRDVSRPVIQPLAEPIDTEGQDD